MVAQIFGTVEHHEDQWIAPTISIPLITTIAFFWEGLGVDKDAVCADAKKTTEAGAGRFEKPAPDARAAPPEAHESLVSRKTVGEEPLTGLTFLRRLSIRRRSSPGFLGLGGGTGLGRGVLRGPGTPSKKPPIEMPGS